MAVDNHVHSAYALEIIIVSIHFRLRPSVIGKVTGSQARVYMNKFLVRVNIRPNWLHQVCTEISKVRVGSVGEYEYSLSPGTCNSF